MKRDFICIICPKGCSLCADIYADQVTVSGNACPKGRDYAVSECINPVRTVTATIRVSNRNNTMVSVKTAAPIPKGAMFSMMELIHTSQAQAPIQIGDVILDDVYGTKVIATKQIP